MNTEGQIILESSESRSQEKFDIIKIIKQKIEEAIGKRAFIRYVSDIEILFYKDYRISFIFEEAKTRCENLIKNHKMEIVGVLQGLWPKIDLNIEFSYTENGEEIVVSLTNQEVASAKKVINITEYSASYSFENLHESTHNQFASQIIKSVSCYNHEQIIQNCGIFYLNGNSGVGKTHLIKASYNFYTQKGGSCCLMTAIEFTKKYVESIQKKTIGSFFEYFLKFEIIYIENINYLIGKKSTLETLINIAKEMMNKEVSFIFSSDLSMDSLFQKEEKFNQIRDFFIDLQIQDPSSDTKKDFIVKQITSKNLKIPIFSSQIIAENSLNYRDIKKNLDKVCVYQKIHKVELNNSLVADILKGKPEDREQKLTSPQGDIKNWANATEESIINAVSAFFKIHSSLITSNSKVSQVCIARCVAIFIMHNYKGLNFSSIGKIFNKNHSTIIFNIEKIKKLLETDPKLPMQISEIKNSIL